MILSFGALSVSKMEEVIGSVGCDCRCPELSGRSGEVDETGWESKHVRGLKEDRRKLRRNGGGGGGGGPQKTHISSPGFGHLRSGWECVNELVTAAQVEKKHLLICHFMRY